MKFLSLICDSEKWYRKGESLRCWPADSSTNVVLVNCLTRQTTNFLSYVITGVVLQDANLPVPVADTISLS